MRTTLRLTPLAFLLIAPGLLAQETQSTVLGTVKDASGKPVAGARIKISSSKLLGDRTLVSGPDGGFRIPLLPPGNYDLSVTADGHVGSKASFYLNAGLNLRQDLVLKPIQTASAVVEIVAASAQADKTETTTKTSYSTDNLMEIRGTGTAGSVAYNALLLAPGSTGSVTYATMRGSGQMGTQYVVNGTSSRDNVTGQGRLGDSVLDDSIEDTAIILSPLNAKYGNSSGGIVSVVTKRGGNEFEGTFRAKLANQAWGAQIISFKNRTGAFSGNPAPRSTDQLNRTYEINLRGPIIKDHLTFAYGTRLVPSVPNTATALNIISNGNTFVRLGATNYQANTFNAGQQESAIQKNTFHQFQLFWQISPNHQIEYNYSQANDSNPDLQANYVTPDAGIALLQTTFRQYYAVGYRGVLGSNQLLEIRYGLNRADTQFPSGPGLPIRLNSGPTGASIRTIWANGNTYFTGGAPSDPVPDKRATRSLTANWNLVLEAHGQHSIDAGFELQEPIWGTVSRGNSAPDQFWGPGQISPTDPAAVLAGVAGKYIVFPYNANIDGLGQLTGTNLNMIPTYQQFFGADKTDVRNPTTALYLNDQWSINNNWSVMGGLRLEKMKLSDAQGTRINTPTMVSPRLEAKWDVFGDQSRVLSASYGHFRGLLNARFYRTFTEGRRNNQATWYWNKNNPATGLAEPYAVSYAEFTNPANYGYLATVATAAAFDIDPKLKPEVAQEFTLGYHRNFTSGGTWRMTFVHRTWKDLWNSFPIAQNLSIPNPANPSAAPITTYKRILVNDSYNKREYNGLEFEWTAPINSWLLFAGNYTYGRTVANNTYGDGTTLASADNYGTPGWWRDQIRAQGISSDLFEPMGEVANSQNHIVKTFLTAHFDNARSRSSVSLVMRYYSAPKFSLTNNVNFATPTALLPGNPDPNLPTAATIFWNGRGQHSTADTYNVDLQYNFEIKLRGTLSVFSQLSVVNVLNHLYPNTWSSDALGAGSAATYANGYQNSPSVTARYGMPTGNAAVSGARAINLDLGFKF